MTVAPTMTRLTWLIALGGVALLAGVLTTETYIWVNWWPLTIGLGTAFVWSLPLLYLWLLTIPLVSWLARRLPLTGPHRVARTLVHVGLSVALAIGTLALLDVSNRAFQWTLLMGAPKGLISELRYTIIHLHLGIALYWVVLGVRHALDSHARLLDNQVRAARLETQLARAQLQALRAQLHPHFLFNTLNSIAVLMRRDSETAEHVLHRLSDLLRVVLERGADAEISLRDELEFLRTYLAIEQVRFGDRLRVTFDVDPMALDAAVPTLVLQPLLENAIRHGVGPRAAGGRIAIGAQVADGSLALWVRDDGPGFPPSFDLAAVTGVGLRNTRARLETLYGSTQRLELLRRDDGGTEVRVTLPIRPNGATGHA